MSKENIVNEALDPTIAYAKIIRDEDGNFHVEDSDGTVGPVCKFCEENDKTIRLTPNASKRQYFSRAKANAEIDEKGYAELFYRAPHPIGPTGSRLPNEKLIRYLPEDLQAEYKAIIERAMAAKAAAKKQPMTELEKAQAKLAKAQAALAALLEEANS